MINQHDKARLHCIHYGGRRSGKSQMMKRAAAMHNFREAMREAFKAGLEHGVDTQGAFTDADEAGFTAFFQAFVAKVTNVPVEAVKAYEEPIRLTPTVELPGPKIEDVLHEIEQAFAVPRELFGMDGARGGRMTSKEPNFTEEVRPLKQWLDDPLYPFPKGEVTTDLADDALNIKRDVVVVATTDKDQDGNTIEREIPRSEWEDRRRNIPAIPGYYMPDAEKDALIGSRDVSDAQEDEQAIDDAMRREDD